MTSDTDMSEVESPEEEAEMEVTSPSRGHKSFAFEPLGMDIYADIDRRQRQSIKIKNQITELDKEYRSRKDPIRSELYIGLKRYFKFHPDRYRAFLEKMPDERFAQFLKPKVGLEKAKSWDQKHKVQRVLRFIELDNTNDRTYLYSTISQLDLIHASKNPHHYEWRAHRLLNIDGGRAQRMSQLPKKAFTNTLKTKITELLETLVENEIETEEKLTYFYPHTKGNDDLVFFGIRKQVCPHPKEGGNRKSSQGKKGKGKRREVKESSETLTIVIKQGFPHLFLSGNMPEAEPIIKVLVESLGYRGSENQNLSGKNIRSLIDTCNRKWTPVSLQALEETFRAEEVGMTERGIRWGNRVTELNRRFQVASFRGTQGDPEERVVTRSSASKKAGTQVISFTSSLGKSTTKFKGTVEELDEHLIEAYEQGFITDLTPFINLKKTQSNQGHLDRED